MINLNLFSSVTDHQRELTQQWWKTFIEKQEIIDRYFSGRFDGELDLPQWMNDHLQCIEKNLFWEFGPGLNRSHRLVITPECHAHLRPLVRYILSQAPELKNWEFYEYRLAENYDRLLEILKGRCGWNDIGNIEFELREGNYNLIDIIFYLPQIKSEDDSFSHMCVLLENYLGEERFDKWVGKIKVKKKRPSYLKLVGAGPSKPFPNVKILPEIFQSKVDEITSKLPDTYFGCKDSFQWSGFKIEPPHQEDYPEKQDLFVATLISGDFFPATYEGRDSFYSERFSRNGEKFIYIKTQVMNVVDNTPQDFNQPTFTDRGQLEDALTDILESKNIGTVIGGGTGYQYSYMGLGSP